MGRIDRNLTVTRWLSVKIENSHSERMGTIRKKRSATPWPNSPQCSPSAVLSIISTGHPPSQWVLGEWKQMRILSDRAAALTLEHKWSSTPQEQCGLTFYFDAKCTTSCTQFIADIVFLKMIEIISSVYNGGMPFMIPVRRVPRNWQLSGIQSIDGPVTSPTVHQLFLPFLPHHPAPNLVRRGKTLEKWQREVTALLDI